MKNRPMFSLSLISCLLSLSAVLPAIALAQGSLPQLSPSDFAPVPSGTAPITSVGGPTKSVIYLINQILYWVSAVFWIAAAGFIIYAAYLYLTGGGDAERIKKAHHQLLWAVVAIAIGILSSGLPTLIRSFLGGS